MKRVGIGASFLLALACVAPPDGVAQAGRQGECLVCHGDVEFLRQQTGSLERAREVRIGRGELGSSAHGGMACGRCHDGFDRYPHPRQGTGTETCRSCHAEATEAWSASAHAAAGPEGAGCAACHGVHAVEPAAELVSEGFVEELSARCVGCHEEAALPATDPHRERVACVGCHGAHGVRSPADRLSTVYPANQPETCGECHDAIATSAARDVHGTTVRDWAAGGPGEVSSEERTPPSCSTCHGAHGMLIPEQEAFPEEIVERCGECHSGYADTYFGTYHGKATALGSHIVATCDDCHTAHAVFPAEDSRSSVAEENLVATCGACHEHARPAFVRYVSHPDHTSPEKNPYIFYSFWFMNSLLIGVLSAFGLHTLLWWVRLRIDKRRGIHHGIGESHD